jgi:hypothetical protein
MKTLLQITLMSALFGVQHATAMPLGHTPVAVVAPVMQIKDRFDSPPIDPNLPAVTGQSINAAVRDELTARFAEAAGTASGLLSRQQAADASWGYVADHFAAIDLDRDGAVKLGDVLRFMQGGSVESSQNIKVVE